jgi:hypothetical protein
MQHCFHEITNQHVVEYLLFNRQHERMARRFKGNTSISHPGIHVDYMSLAANRYTNKTKLILDMVEALKNRLLFLLYLCAQRLGPVIAELRGRKHLWRRFGLRRSVKVDGSQPDFSPVGIF